MPPRPPASGANAAPMPGNDANRPNCDSKPSIAPVGVLSADVRELKGMVSVLPTSVPNALALRADLSNSLMNGLALPLMVTDNFPISGTGIALGFVRLARL